MEGAGKVSGRARYASDVRLPGMHAVHPSNLAPMLLAFDAAVRVCGSSGLPLRGLLALPAAERRRETVLLPA